MNKLTKENADTVMANLAKLVKNDPELLSNMNEWLDELHDQDTFGTEGQLDPRGDQRD